MIIDIERLRKFTALPRNEGYWPPLIRLDGVEFVADEEDHAHAVKLVVLLCQAASSISPLLDVYEAVETLFSMVDLTDPNCPIGIALTKAGLVDLMQRGGQT